MTKFAHSTRKRSDYTPKRTKAMMYEASWGTRATRETRQMTSLVLAKHPLKAWLGELRILAERKGTKAEAAEVYMLIQRVDGLRDFKGTERFAVHLVSLDIKAEAALTRL